jgi:protocatechuate 3,4-dioxygenase beta subunit
MAHQTPRNDDGHNHDDEHDEHDRGLGYDLQTMFGRRKALSLFAGVGAIALVGCGDDDADNTATTTSPTADTTTGSANDSAAPSCDDIPAETAGPYPGDGSNGPNVLTESGIVRRDITSSFGSSRTKAEGIPLQIDLTILDNADGCAPMAGAAVYLWHCDRDGQYSLYADGLTGENYLRGVQEAGADGKVSFTSIFPAAYSGRWPHIHFEVYSSLEEATSAGSISATSQIALPQDVCEQVYATEGYGQSVSNLAQTSLQTDMVFSDDGGVRQLATMSGSVSDGLTATLSIPV